MKLTDRVTLSIGSQKIRDVSLADAARLATVILGWAVCDEQSFAVNPEEVGIANDTVKTWNR